MDSEPEPDIYRGGASGIGRIGQSLILFGHSGTNSTMSNVVYQAGILDSRGYEANNPGECEDVRRGLCIAKEGRRQTLAGCRYHEFGNSARSGKDCSKGDFGAREEVETPSLCPFSARAIRRVREEQGINQEEAAERCGLHRTYDSGIERGVRNVSLVNIERIARGLRISLPNLFSRL